MFKVGRAKTRRILVAEDDPISSRLIKRLVKNEGYEPVVVNDGGAAYRLLRTDSNFRGAILDMVMPHLEGLDVMRFMQTEKRLLRIPVMMLTSQNDLNLMTKSFTAGVSIFLQKPFTKEQFEIMFRLLLSNGKGLKKAG